MIELNNQVLLDTKEACGMLHCSPKMLRQYRQQFNLPVLKISKQYYTPKTAIETAILCRLNVAADKGEGGLTNASGS